MNGEDKEMWGVGTPVRWASVLTCGHNSLKQETDAPTRLPPDTDLSVRSWKIVNKCHHKPPKLVKAEQKRDTKVNVTQR